MYSFGRSRFLGQPDTFRITLAYQVSCSGVPLSSAYPGSPVAPRLQRALSMQPSIDLPPTEPAPLASHRYELAEVEWTSDDSDSAVQKRLHQASVNPDLVNEYVHVAIHSIGPHTPGGITKASAPQDIVEVQLAVEQTPPQLRRLELIRVSTTGSVSASLLSDMLHYCDLEGLTRLRFSEGMLQLWDDSLLSRLAALRSLNLSNCGLSAIPSDVGQLTSLRELRMSDNTITQLPKDISKLVHLKRLVADHNLLSAIPGRGFEQPYSRRCFPVRVMSTFVLDTNASPMVMYACVQTVLDIYRNPATSTALTQNAHISSCHVHCGDRVKQGMGAGDVIKASGMRVKGKGRRGQGKGWWTCSWMHAQHFPEAPKVTCFCS